MEMRIKTAAHFRDAAIRPMFLILHHTASNADMSGYLAKPGDGRKVSVHFHITRTGAVTRYSNLVDLRMKTAMHAYHAGASRWTYKGKVYTGLNAHSIGIELDGDGKTAFTPPQLSKMYALCTEIMSAFQIPPECVLGHKEISPRRKIDPSPMDMEEVRTKLSRSLAAEFGPATVSEMETAAELLAIIWHGGKGVLSRVPQGERAGHPLVKMANEVTAHVKKKHGLK